MKYAFMILLLSWVAHAAPEKSSGESTPGEEVQERAKRRIYPGGQDESDLKVQVQIVNPTRKVAPSVEGFSEEPGND